MDAGAQIYGEAFDPFSDQLGTPVNMASGTSSNNTGGKQCAETCEKNSSDSKPFKGADEAHKAMHLRTARCDVVDSLDDGGDFGCEMHPERHIKERSSAPSGGIANAVRKTARGEDTVKSWDLLKYEFFSDELEGGSGDGEMDYGEEAPLENHEEVLSAASRKTVGGGEVVADVASPGRAVHVPVEMPPQISPAVSNAGYSLYNLLEDEPPSVTNSGNPDGGYGDPLLTGEDEVISHPLQLGNVLHDLVTETTGKDDGLLVSPDEPRVTLAERLGPGRQPQELCSPDTEGVLPAQRHLSAASGQNLRGTWSGFLEVGDLPSLGGQALDLEYDGDCVVGGSPITPTPTGPASGLHAGLAKPTSAEAAPPQVGLGSSSGTGHVMEELQATAGESFTPVQSPFLSPASSQPQSFYNSYLEYPMPSTPVYASEDVSLARLASAEGHDEPPADSQLTLHQSHKRLVPEPMKAPVDSHCDPAELCCTQAHDATVATISRTPVVKLKDSNDADSVAQRDGGAPETQRFSTAGPPSSSSYQWDMEPSGDGWYGWDTEEYPLEPWEAAATPSASEHESLSSKPASLHSQSIWGEDGTLMGTAVDTEKGGALEKVEDGFIPTSSCVPQKAEVTPGTPNHAQTILLVTRSEAEVGTEATWSFKQRTATVISTNGEPSEFEFDDIVVMGVGREGTGQDSKTLNEFMHCFLSGQNATLLVASDEASTLTCISVISDFCVKVATVLEEARKLSPLSAFEFSLSCGVVDSERNTMMDVLAASDRGPAAKFTSLQLGSAAILGKKVYYLSRCKANSVQELQQLLAVMVSRSESIDLSDGMFIVGQGLLKQIKAASEAEDVLVSSLLVAPVSDDMDLLCKIADGVHEGAMEPFAGVSSGAVAALCVLCSSQATPPNECAALMRSVCRLRSVLAGRPRFGSAQLTVQHCEYQMRQLARSLEQGELDADAVQAVNEEIAVLSQRCDEARAILANPLGGDPVIYPAPCALLLPGETLFCPEGRSRLSVGGDASSEKYRDTPQGCLPRSTTECVSDTAVALQTPAESRSTPAAGQQSYAQPTLIIDRNRAHGTPTGHIGPLGHALQQSVEDAVADVAGGRCAPQGTEGACTGRTSVLEEVEATVMRKAHISTPAMAENKTSPLALARAGAFGLNPSHPEGDDCGGAAALQSSAEQMSSHKGRSVSDNETGGFFPRIMSKLGFQPHLLNGHYLWADSHESAGDGLLEDIAGILPARDILGSDQPGETGEEDDEHDSKVPASKLSDDSAQRWRPQTASLENHDDETTNTAEEDLALGFSFPQSNADEAHYLDSEMLPQACSSFPQEATSAKTHASRQNVVNAVRAVTIVVSEGTSPTSGPQNVQIASPNRIMIQGRGSSIRQYDVCEALAHRRHKSEAEGAAPFDPVSSKVLGNAVYHFLSGHNTSIMVSATRTQRQTACELVEGVMMMAYRRLSAGRAAGKLQSFSVNLALGLYRADGAVVDAACPSTGLASAETGDMYSQPQYQVVTCVGTCVKCLSWVPISEQHQLSAMVRRAVAQIGDKNEPDVLVGLLTLKQAKGAEGKQDVYVSALRFALSCGGSNRFTRLTAASVEGPWPFFSSALGGSDVTVVVQCVGPTDVSSDAIPDAHFLAAARTIQNGTVHTGNVRRIAEYSCTRLSRLKAILAVEGDEGQRRVLAETIDHVLVAQKACLEALANPHEPLVVPWKETGLRRPGITDLSDSLSPLGEASWTDQ